MGGWVSRERKDGSNEVLDTRGRWVGKWVGGLVGREKELFVPHPGGMRRPSPSPIWVCRVGGWVGGWVDGMRRLSPLLLRLYRVGGWVSYCGYIKVEESEAVGMSCCMLAECGWVGG